MNDKKGQGLSVNYIVIIAIALVVLVIIVLFFTGALKGMIPKTEIYQNVDSSTRQIWTNQCELACQSGENNYCSTYFQVDTNSDNEIDEIYLCSRVTGLGDNVAGIANYASYSDANSLMTTKDGVEIDVKELSSPCAAVTECK